jgi:outer membrane immunogenic protein
MHFKTYLLSTASALAVAGAVSLNPAYAADIPARMPVKAPVVEAPFSWTGFYIGAHGGGAWLKHRQTTSFPNGACDTGTSSAPADIPSDCTLKDSGAAFGGFAGYNFQSGRLVYGVEVDGSWLNLKRTLVESSQEVVDPLTTHTKVSWMATVRGRIGVTMSPTLLYATGGVAFGRVKSGWFDGETPPTLLAVDKVKTGWVAGAGIEHAFARNWLVRFEALYHDLGKSTAGPVTNGGETYTTTFRHRITTVRAGLALRW